MSKETNFEDGLYEIIRTIEDSKERQFLAAVYGWPDSGKTYLIDRVSDYFEGNGLFVQKFYSSVNNFAFGRRIDMQYSENDLILFHCEWDRGVIGDINRREIPIYAVLNKPKNDPNILAQKLGRQIHLNVGIQNPNFYSKENYAKLTGTYDLIITNLGSREK